MENFKLNKAFQKALKDRGIRYDFDHEVGVYRIYLSGIVEEVTLNGAFPRDIRERILSKPLLSPPGKALS